MTGHETTILDPMANNIRPACRKRASDESKPCSVTLPKPLQEAIIRRANQDDRSFSATVRRALEAYVSRPA